VALKAIQSRPCDRLVFVYRTNELGEQLPSYKPALEVMERLVQAKLL
jgi:hypothetical protein